MAKGTRLGKRKKVPLVNPANETEPRIQLQILYNLLRHVEDDPSPPNGWNAWAMGLAQKRIHRLQRLAKVYVKKSGGIT